MQQLQRPLGPSRSSGWPRHRAPTSRVPRVPSSSATDAPSSSRPQRGVIILPGLGNNQADYTALSAQLEARGYAVETVPIARIDWSRNAAALTDPNWWRGTLQPRPAVDWYLQKLDASMQALKRRIDGAPVSMLTHSAGGWLGRVYLLNFGQEGVDHYVSLGSPHQPPPAGIVDQTRGLLSWCSEKCPGAFHPEIAYTSVSGRFIKGAELGGDGKLLAKLAGLGYAQVCGQADVWGDVIVPEPSAHLNEGAASVILDGVFHSPLGEKLPFFGPWYGSASVLDQWVQYLGSSEPR